MPWDTKMHLTSLFSSAASGKWQVAFPPDTHFHSTLDAHFRLDASFHLRFLVFHAPNCRIRMAIKAGLVANVINVSCSKFPATSSSSSRTAISLAVSLASYANFHHFELVISRSIFISVPAFVGRVRDQLFMHFCLNFHSFSAPRAMCNLRCKRDHRRLSLLENCISLLFAA